MEFNWDDPDTRLAVGFTAGLLLGLGGGYAVWGR